MVLIIMAIHLVTRLFINRLWYKTKLRLIPRKNLSVTRKWRNLQHTGGLLQELLAPLAATSSYRCCVNYLREKRCRGRGPGPPHLVINRDHMGPEGPEGPEGPATVMAEINARALVADEGDRDSRISILIGTRGTGDCDG